MHFSNYKSKEIFSETAFYTDVFQLVSKCFSGMERSANHLGNNKYELRLHYYFILRVCNKKNVADFLSFGASIPPLP